MTGPLFALYFIAYFLAAWLMKGESSWPMRTNVTDAANIDKGRLRRGLIRLTTFRKYGHGDDRISEKRHVGMVLFRGLLIFCR